MSTHHVLLEYIVKIPRIAYVLLEYIGQISRIPFLRECAKKCVQTPAPHSFWSSHAPTGYPAVWKGSQREDHQLGDPNFLRHTHVITMVPHPHLRRSGKSSYLSQPKRKPKPPPPTKKNTRVRALSVCGSNIGAQNGALVNGLKDHLPHGPLISF